MRLDFRNPAEYRPHLNFERVALAIALAVLFLIGVSDALAVLG